MKYSDALLTHVKATFKNSNNNKTADILFIKVDEDVISVLYSTFPMDDDKEILYITELNGDFIDSYIVEDGLLIKRLFFTKEENSSQKQAKTQQKMDYPLGCEDISDIVDSLYDILGFSVSSCSESGNGTYSIYGNFGTMLFDGITITVTGADQRRNNSNQDNINQDCETSNCDDDQDNGGGGSTTNSNTRTERDRQREMAARIAAQEKKCKDKGMLYVKGECVVDTESPCPIEGMTRNSEGKCERPCPDGFVRGNGVNSPRCVEEDQIINELEDKAKCVYEKLEKLSTGFKDAIKKFDGDFPVSHLNLIMEDLGNTRGETRAPDGAGTSPDYVITIAINNNSNIHGASYRPNLMTAKTIAHEVIHAEMFRKLLSLAKQGNLNFSNWTRQQQIDFTLAIKNDFPGIYDYYKRHKDWQHEQMASHYRKTIADILKDFDNNQRQNQFYLDIAWEGLIKSNISSWTDLSQQEQDRIKKVISDYINTNKNENCQ
jgi:hypothetical protein